MSDYSSRIGLARAGRAESAVSVGDTIDANQVYNSSHPLYKVYTEELQKRMSEIVARESEKQAKAHQAVCTVALSPEAKDGLVSEYPEFRIVWPQWRVPVHATWVARRQLLNQYMTHHLRRYAGSYVHYGGEAVSYLTAHLSDVSLCVSAESAVAVHESYEDDVACAKLVASAATAATALGWLTDTRQLRDYAGQNTLRKVVRTSAADCKGDALVVDGGLYAMSPLQFGTAMLQHGASVGMFAMPYHPSMLVHCEGYLPGTDVHYRLDEHEVKFRYPEGVAGVTAYSSSVWHQWLVNTVRNVDGLPGVSFQYELLGLRGTFMVVRVVRVDTPTEVKHSIVHSLQLESQDDLTLVKTWRLKSLAVDATKESAWEQVVITVPTRVVEKTHDYAMALPAADFSRHAIRKRLAVVNDRVIVQGTTVEVHDALQSDALDSLEIAIFTHCFVARYESGRLAASLRAVVDEVAGFGALGFMSRLCHVMTACATLAYDWSLGRVDEALRDAFDRARVWLRGLPKHKRSTFEPAPQFIRYESMVNKRLRPLIDAVSTAVVGLVCYSDLEPNMPGFKFLAALGSVRATGAVPVPVIGADFEVSRNGVQLYSDVVDTASGGEGSHAAVALRSKLRGLNEFDQDDGRRHLLSVVAHVSDLHAQDVQRDDYQYDPGFRATLDDFHEAVIPGMRNVDFKYDPSSISVDDQDRSLAAEYLDMPLDMGGAPPTMQVFESKLGGYNVTKRPGTLQETLSAFHARTLSAPVLAIPQHDEELVQEVFGDFLDVACLPDARQKLLQYQNDPVSLEERALMDWSGKARPENVVKVFKYLVDNPVAMEEYMVGRYDSMIKTDVKPPLSDKPLQYRVEPQVIVHHIPAVNAVFSSIFRVLVRRFQSLLKPNFMVNLLKDMPAVRDVVQNYHEWGTDCVYLENDFSKYDKSQGQFVHLLERHVFQQLGMNSNMLEQWGLGHVDCDIRSVTTGLSLHVRYQRKSGDATTAFGNGLLNIMSVVHAYKGSDIVWAVFMGDDSLVEARTVCSGERAVRALAEKFNLQAKFFVTNAPYFASHFVLINEDERRVTCVPDPVKRVEKWSMAVSAVDPKWDERYISAVNSLAVYGQRSNLVGLGRAIYVRYGMRDGIEPQAIGDAIASAIRTYADFRSMWREEAMKIQL